jgi:hypothetical protein
MANIGWTPLSNAKLLGLRKQFGVTGKIKTSNKYHDHPKFGGAKEIARRAAKFNAAAAAN